MPLQRKLRESHKRIVAARQAWRCASCERLLDSTFQMDHTIPLWRGGADDISNCQVVCPCCHAQKTQREEIERADLRRQAREEAAERARRAHEASVRQEELARASETTDDRSGVRECSLCRKRYYPLFKHRCPVVERRIAERMRPARPTLRALRRRRGLADPTAKELADNPWARFYFTKW